ncbi:MAG: hypothetical protein J6D21_04260 [Clostridia bacterium]|nr:hypothetical protein [Clostridia bacterium]
MIYPSIQELTKDKFNKYTLVIATAKCARLVTNEYTKQRDVAERMIANKETEKSLASMIKKEYRDEKAVKNAVVRMKEGDFRVVLPGEEGYEDSIVDIEALEEAYRIQAAAEAAAYEAEKKRSIEAMAEENRREAEGLLDDELGDEEFDDEFDDIPEDEEDDLAEDEDAEDDGAELDF